MTIEKKQNGNELELKVIGHLDASTAPKLQEIIDASIMDTEKLTFDFEELEYVSSAGLRVILNAQKIMMEQGSMKLVGVNEAVMEIFELTGFDDILIIE